MLISEQIVPGTYDLTGSLRGDGRREHDHTILLQCNGTLIVYERMGIDWRRNAAFIFVVLCRCPIIITAYFRAGAFGGLHNGDRKIFLASVLNLYWIMAGELIGRAIAAMWAYINYWGDI